MKLLVSVILILSVSTLASAQDTTINNPLTDAVCKRYTTSTTSSNCGGSVGETCMKCEECTTGKPNGWKKGTDFILAQSKDATQAKTYQFFCTSYIAPFMYVALLAALHLVISF